MRILQILTYYAPHWTGLTRHAQIAAEGLARKGNEVTVLAVRHSPDLDQKEVLNGVRVIRVPPICRFSRGLIAPTFLYQAVRLMRSHDVVQIHTPLPEAPAVASFAKLLGRPLVMTHHGDIVMPAGLVNRSIEWAAGLLMSSAGHLASAVTSYSDDYAESSRLLRPLSSKLSSILPPVEIPPVVMEDGTALGKELNLGDGPVIGFAGRWVEEKGFDVLLDAVPDLVRTYPAVKLVYAGEAPDYETFFARCRPAIKRAGDHLVFAGLIRDRRRMAAFYRACDVVVLPSRSDMFALVQVEALLCGTPLVATDIPGLRVVVQKTGMGMLVPPEQPSALAAAIRHVLDNPERFRPDPVQIQALFNCETAVDNYEALLQKTIMSGRH